MGFDAAGIRDLSDLSGLLFRGKLVKGESRRLILDLHVSLIDPHRNILPGQAQLPIQTPMLEPDVPVVIDLTCEWCRVQRPREPFFREGSAQNSAQDRMRAVSPVLARLVRNVFFAIVVRPPGLMRLLDLRPALGLRESEVCEPPLDRDYVELKMLS